MHTFNLFLYNRNEEISLHLSFSRDILIYTTILFSEHRLTMSQLCTYLVIIGMPACRLYEMTLDNL